MNSSGQGYTSQVWGVTNDHPVEGDYDGDGKTDFAIFHPADGSWQVLQSSNSAFFGFHSDWRAMRLLKQIMKATEKPIWRFSAMKTVMAFDIFAEAQTVRYLFNNGVRD